ncbi:MAG: adenylate kinase [Clostridia bacterium]|nr:adenylate kinase [Clostridia bacterium]
MKLVFLGPPGAGKGTQAAGVCQRFAIPHISTGDMLRAAIAKGTETGLKAKVFMDQGQLVPDEVLVQMVKERLSESDCANGYLLDGFPRTVKQAEALDLISKPDVTVDVEVPDEKLLARLTGRRVCMACKGTFHVTKLGDSNICPDCGGELIQRDDDKPATIQKRLDVYHSQTAPLIDYYEKSGILKKVDGDQARDEVLEAILVALGG